MSAKFTARDFNAASGSASIWQILGTAVIAVQILLCARCRCPAAITATGNVSPSNPAGWTSSTIGYIGMTSTGSVTVDSGSDLLSSYACLGYNSGSTGRR